MEIELKYRIPSRKVADEIWNDKLFFQYEEDGSREELSFKGKYFDTKDCDLAKNQIAYRVRKEGGGLVATLKWKGMNEGALHVREEINVPVEDDKPDLKVFRESDIGGRLLDIIGEKPVYSILETRFHRRRFRIDTGEGIFEVSIDEGWIVTPYGEEPISEVEIELFSGETDELKNIGAKLRKKYGLEKEEHSKYYRGMKIIEAAVSERA